MNLNVNTFRPISSDETVRDEHGHEWKRVTEQGWYRTCDKYFWPWHPNKLFHGQSPPTVKEVAQRRYDLDPFRGVANETIFGSPTTK